MMTRHIRTVALAICHDSIGRVFVERGYDRVRDEHYLRGIGGGVEFGERAEDALRREWREEFGLTLRGPKLLTVVENLFTHEGVPGHEIVFIFSAEIVESWAYAQQELERTEPNGLVHTGIWASVAELQVCGLACYPLGFLDLCAQLESTV
jgi:ADP-ribose pyrophosphatase YjhB (NUDIX family)